MKINVNTQNKLAPLGDLFGIFFEDINHSADGGLYGELIRNRSFEFCEVDNPKYNHMTAWEPILPADYRGRLMIQSEHPVSRKNPHYLVIDAMEPIDGIGVRNHGYNSGIPVEEGNEYSFSMYIACDGRPAEVKVSLESADGGEYCAEILEIISTDWEKKQLVFTAPKTDWSARLAIRLVTPGRVYIDNVSLFPKDTYMNRENGMRKDLAQLLADLKPKFMRFPGGCLVHDGSINPDDRDSLYRWKNTIGDTKDRPSRKSNWGYNQSLGLGYYEYFLLCEDIGAKPLPVLPAGYDPHHQRLVPFEQLDEWIADALDLIEFANDDASTKWGKIRCELGHEKPFNLEYLGIGNEEVGDGFFERYPYFHKAIKEKYPEIKLINSAGPFVGGGEFKKGWMSAMKNGSDLIDEHYYLAPEWFIANHHHYDKINPFAKTKVFLGEYASWGNTWYNALAEASYMIGLERNAKNVELACYAPLFCNVDYVNWKPDMIWYDNHRAMATPNYYVQKLFMNHQGDVGVECNAETELQNELRGYKSGKEIYLKAQPNTEVKYTDIKIIDGDKVIICPDVILKSGDAPVKLGEIESDNYRISMKAVMTSGIRGFMLLFDYADDLNNRSWEIGGWQNMDCAVCENIDGRNTCLDQYGYTVKKDIEYELMLDCAGRRMTCYITGENESVLTNKAKKTELVIEPIYCVASVENETGDTIVKTVNLRKSGYEAEIKLDKPVQGAEVYYMSGYALNAENTLDEPENVTIKETSLTAENGVIKYEIPAESVCVFRIK